MQKILIALTVFLSTSMAVPFPPSVTLTVKVKGFESQDGQMLLALYDDEEGFPSNPKLSSRKLSRKIEGEEVSVTLKGLQPGYYAVVVLHDENNNGEMDTNFLGIPKEGFGTSNDAKGRMGPPNFEDAKFKLQSDEVIEINMR